MSFSWWICLFQWRHLEDSVSVPICHIIAFQVICYELGIYSVLNFGHLFNPILPEHFLYVCIVTIYICKFPDGC